MSKRNKIIYWVATVWLSFGMLSSGIIQVLRLKDEVTFMTELGYPVYFLTILGVWKILGVVAILAPKYPLVKEWAYAGFFIAMSGAVFSHIASGDTLKESIPALLLTVLTVVSWYFRPASRKIIVVKQ